MLSHRFLQDLLKSFCHHSYHHSVVSRLDAGLTHFFLPQKPHLCFMLSIHYLCTLLSQLAHNVARSLLMVISGCKICFAILAKLEASKSNPITNGWHQGHSIHILYTVSDQSHFHLSQLRESCPAIYCRVAPYYSQGKKVDLLFVALFPLSLTDFTCLSVVTLPNTSTWHSWQFASLRSKNHQNCRHFCSTGKAPRCVKAQLYKYRWIQNEWQENSIYSSLYNLTDGLELILMPRIRAKWDTSLYSTGMLLLLFVHFFFSKSLISLNFCD